MKPKTRPRPSAVAARTAKRSDHAQALAKSIVRWELHKEYAVGVNGHGVGIVWMPAEDYWTIRREHDDRKRAELKR